MRGSLRSEGGAIEPQHFVLEGEASPQWAEPLADRGADRAGGPLRGDVEAFERARILDALEQAGGNQTRAAQLLGVSRRTLVSRLTEYGMTKPRERRGAKRP